MNWLTLVARVVAGVAVLSAGCLEPSPSPAAVASDFVARVRLAETEAGRRDAFELLSRAAQDALRTRAAAAAAVAGVPAEAVAPWDVARYGGLVGGDRLVSVEAVQVAEDQATVRVHMARYYGAARAPSPAGAGEGGGRPDGPGRLVRLVREAGAWKVALDFSGVGSKGTP